MNLASSNVRNGFRKGHLAGFTLIELLVVIAIIGILSAIVLASLSTARTKGADAAIEADLSSVHTEAEIYYNSAGNNTYGTATSGTTCNAGMYSADLTIAAAVTNIKTNQAGTLTADCNSVPTAYAMDAKLNSTGAGYFCIDSTGQAKIEPAALAAASTKCI